MLEAGGLLDQPVGLWFNVNYAGGVWDFLGRMNRIPFDVDSLTAGEKRLYAQICDLLDLYPELEVIDEEEDIFGGY